MTANDLTHLDALQTRLANEQRRLDLETNPNAVKLRKVWVEGIKKEISDVYKFAGEVEPAAMPSDDDAALLAELGL